MKKAISIFSIFCIFLLHAGITNAAEAEIFGIADDEEVRRSLSAETAWNYLL